VKWKSLSQSEATWHYASELPSDLRLFESYYNCPTRRNPDTHPKWVDDASKSLAKYWDKTGNPPAVEIWDHNPFVEVIGTTVLDNRKYFKVLRANCTVILMERDTLMQLQPALLVDYFEKRLNAIGAVD
jgi:hypothetical protein